MGTQFTPEELREMARLARVYAAGLSAERFQALVETQSQVGETGVWEAAWALVRLQKDWGVPANRLLDRVIELKKELPHLEATRSQCAQQLASLKENIQAAQQELRQTKAAVDQASREKASLEKEVAALREGTSREKVRLADEVEKARADARMSIEEINRARHLAARVKARGLAIDFVLDLLQGIPQDAEAKERLRGAIQRSGSLVADNEAQEKRLQTNAQQADRLEREQRDRQEALSRLRADEKFEMGLRRFHQRYNQHVPLLDYLATWYGVVFYHCLSCGARFWLESKAGPDWYHRGYPSCPCCPYRTVERDRYIYQVLGLPVDNRYCLHLNLGG